MLSPYTPSAISVFIRIMKSIQISSKDQDINCLGLISKNMSNLHALKKRLTVQPTYWTGQITERILQLFSQYKFDID